jgi:hypothetical protein
MIDFRTCNNKAVPSKHGGGTDGWELLLEIFLKTLKFQDTFQVRRGENMGAHFAGWCVEIGNFTILINIFIIPLRNLNIIMHGGVHIQ